MSEVFWFEMAVANPPFDFAGFISRRCALILYTYFIS